MRHLMLALAASTILLGVPAASAQCYTNPTGETAVGLKNASSYFITLYVDGVNKGGVPSGDRSVDFVVTPGEHTLRAEALINGEVISASRIANIPAGYVCTWTVTDPQKAAPGTTSRNAPFKLFDSLERDRIFVTIAIPN